MNSRSNDRPQPKNRGRSAISLPPSTTANLMDGRGRSGASKTVSKHEIDRPRTEIRGQSVNSERHQGSEATVHKAPPSIDGAFGRSATQWTVDPTEEGLRPVINELTPVADPLDDLPKCFTCGAPPDGTFHDGSPRYRHSHAKGIHMQEPEPAKNPATVNHRPQKLNVHFVHELWDRRRKNTPAGVIASNVLRDRCLPLPGNYPSYDAIVTHIRTVHPTTKPQVLDGLQSMWEEWRDNWLATGVNPGYVDGDVFYVYPPREPIIEVAIATALPMGRSNLWYCWNDEPGSQTQGHFNGNKSASLALYPADDSFFCHQCGIWGWSDQLKARTWQGIAR